MKDKKLLFDRKCHVLYSRPCKKEIWAKIALHYPEAERETVWEKVQRQYAVFLSDWRTDLGGKKNFHNGVGGTYFPQAEIRGLQQAVLEEADVQGVCAGEMRL